MDSLKLAISQTAFPHKYAFKIIIPTRRKRREKKKKRPLSCSSQRHACLLTVNY